MFADPAACVLIADCANGLFEESVVLETTFERYFS